MLAETSNAVVALRLDNQGPTSIRMTLGEATTSVNEQVEGDTGNVGRLAAAAVDNLVTTAVIGFDVDGDGKESPLTDGVLLMRYMDGDHTRDPENWTVGAIGIHASRGAGEIADYIDETYDRIEQTDNGNRYRTLDIDGDGHVFSKTDGVLISRFLAGFSGAVLTTGALGNGATRTNDKELRDFLRFGRVTTNNAEVQLRNENDELETNQGLGFDDVVQYRNVDVFGVDDALDASEAVPGTASGNAASSGATSAVRGASAENATVARRGTVARAEELSALEFILANFGEQVTYEEIYLVDQADEELDKNRHELVSRVAEGAPANYANAGYENLTEADVEARIRRSSSTRVLGIDEPIFLQAPDAAGYTYSTGNSGFLFKEIVIDTQVGDNGYLSGGFDLFRSVKNPQGDHIHWEFEAFIEAGNPDLDAGDGILRYQLRRPSDTFQLFPAALPSIDIHQENNLAAPSLHTTTGFILVPPAERLMAPKIEMTPVAHRNAPYDPPVVELPVHLNDPFRSSTNTPQHTFSIIREAESAIIRGARSYSNWGLTNQTVQLASANQITIKGSDNVDDVLTVDFRLGPIHTPVHFDGGLRRDTVRLIGRGNQFDLSTHVLSGVEHFDIGANILRLDVEVLKAFQAADDTVEITGTGDGTSCNRKRLGPAHRQPTAQSLSPRRHHGECCWVRGGGCHRPCGT